MVAKKKVKRVAKKSVKKVSKKTKKVINKPKKMVRSNKRKIEIVLKNLILFAILFILSLVLYNVSGNEMYTNLFLLLSMLFGFVSIAFLIALLALLFLKVMKK